MGYSVRKILAKVVCAGLALVAIEKVTAPSQNQKDGYTMVRSLTTTSSTTATRTSEKSHQHKCASTLLKENLKDVQNCATNWTTHIHDHYSKAQFEPEMKKHSHARFFPFEKMATCKTMTEIGRPPNTDPNTFVDDSKMICGLEELETLNQGKCIIYSIGSNNWWQFEESILEKTKNCEIHTFDCTGPVARFNRKPNNERSHFHHWCVGDTHVPAIPKEECTEQNQICGEVLTLQQVQERLGHDHVDLLKMDIEGFEFSIIQSWWKAMKEGHPVRVPSQMLVEIHYNTYVNMAAIIRHPFMTKAIEEKRLPEGGEEVMLSAVDLVMMQHMLIDLGYILVFREDNPYCSHCSEMVFVNIPMD